MDALLEIPAIYLMHLLEVVGCLLLELAQGGGLRLESAHRHAVVLHHLGNSLQEYVGVPVVHKSIQDRYAASIQ